MENQQKQRIVEQIEAEKQRVGSYNKIATRACVSPATISQMINGNWELITDKLWSQVAAVVNYGFAGNWNYVVTTNYRDATKAIELAHNDCLFLGIAADAGAGKTVALESYVTKNHNTYYISAREWAKREFLRNLATSLGLKAVYYHTGNQLETQIIDYFVKNSARHQLLIVDQANSLKLSAIKFFIHLYNAMKGKMGIVMVGTEALEEKIKRGVHNKTNGFDEVDSRLGRNFIHLIGNTSKDVANICAANGIEDKTAIRKIFSEAYPESVTVGDDENRRTIRVVKDTRRIERIIKRELKKAAQVA